MIFDGVEFDDYVDDGCDGGKWSQVCKKHSEKWGGKENKILHECAGTPICGVKGCNKKAKYYIDFPSDEKTIIGE